MTELNQLEKELIDSIISSNDTDHPTLKLQLPYLKVKERNFTGVGMYVDFYLEENNVIDKRFGDFVISDQKLLKIDKINNPISYELNVVSGVITFLELVTNGNESWDGTYDKYKLINYQY